MFMQKFNLSFIVVSVILLICSCDINKVESGTDLLANDTPPIEVAYPEYDTKKVLVELPNGLIVEKLDSLYILGGDMILSEDGVISAFEQVSDTKSVAISDICNYWPDGIVYYQIDPSILKAQQVAINGAMQMWSSVTGVKFIQSSTSNRVLFKYDAESNSSWLGYAGLPTQEILLSSKSTGVIAHEIGHALGLVHEHCKIDRDNYINVNYDNINIDKAHNFNINPNSFSSLANGIDFNSIMIYSSYVPVPFSINPKQPVMTKKNGDTWVGQRDSLSFSDIEVVRFIYGPPFYKSTPALVRDDSFCVGNVDVVDVEYSHTLSFYSDRTMLNRITTSNPRQIRLKKVTKIREYGYPDETRVENLIFTVPAGTYTISLPNTREFRQYELGNETRYEYSFYVEYHITNYNL